MSQAPFPPQQLPLVHLRYHVPAPEGVSRNGRPPLLLLLHGVGSNERDLFDLAPAFRPGLVVLSVRAPLVQGPDSYAWFTVRFTDSGPVINPDELRSSRDTLLRFIGAAADAYHTDPMQVYLFGFSQGAILALTLALTAPRLLAGVVACSGRIPPEVVPWAVPPAESAGLPVLWLHGTRDQVLPLVWAQRARPILERQRIALTYHEYDAGHWLSPQMLQDATRWLEERMSAAPWHEDAQEQASE